MLSLVKVTVSMAQEAEVVRRLRCVTVSEYSDLSRLQVRSQSTRTFVTKESSTSFWVNTIKTGHTHAATTCYNERCCVFSGILMQMEESPDEDDVVALEIKSDIQLILSALCETDMHRKVRLRLWLQ